MKLTCCSKSYITKVLRKKAEQNKKCSTCCSDVNKAEE